MCLRVCRVSVPDHVRACTARLRCGVHSWVMCVSPRGPTPVPTAVSEEAWLLPDCPTWAQLGPQSLPWQRPDLNIWPHLPTRKGVLELTAELEGSSPPAACTRPREGQGWHQVTWQMEAEQGPSPSLESLNQDRGSPGPHRSCPPSGVHRH